MDLYQTLDLRRSLKDMLVSQAAASFELKDLLHLPRPILQRFKASKSGPLKPAKRMVLDHPICPICCKVKLQGGLTVSSQEFLNEKQCKCDQTRVSPMHSHYSSLAARKIRKQQHRDRSIIDWSRIMHEERNPPEKQTEAIVMRLAPLKTPHKRVSKLLRASLLDLQLLKRSPRPSPRSLSPPLSHCAPPPPAPLVPIEIRKDPVIITKEEERERRFFALPGNNGRLVAKAMKRRKGWKAGKSSNGVDFAWHPTSATVRFDRLVPYQSLQIVNHFENHSELTNKLSLYKNLQAYCESHNLEINEFLPITFSLDFTSNRFHAQYSNFTCFFKSLAEGNKEKAARVPSTHNSGENVWLLKPSGYNRGIGICIFASLDDFKTIVDQYHESAKLTPASDHPKRKTKVPSISFVIQKYIERPMLIDSRKFDIRMWVLLTAEMQGFLYREGYLRTSSEPFTLEKTRLASNFVHLTNNAVQRFSPFYSKFEAGNQLSFAQLQDYLARESKGVSLERDLFPRMKTLVRVSLASVLPSAGLQEAEPIEAHCLLRAFRVRFHP